MNRINWPFVLVTIPLCVLSACFSVWFISLVLRHV